MKGAFLNPHRGGKDVFYGEKSLPQHASKQGTQITDLCSFLTSVLQLILSFIQWVSSLWRPYLLKYRRVEHSLDFSLEDHAIRVTVKLRLCWNTWNFLQFFGYISACNQSVCAIFSGNTYFYICDHLKLRKLKSEKIIFLTL